MTGLDPCGDDADCREVLEAMYQFLDKELAASRRTTVQVHLEGCVPCSEAFEFEAELKQMIANRCQDEVPRHLYERIRSSLRIEIEKHGGTIDESSGGGIPAV